MTEAPFASGGLDREALAAALGLTPAAVAGLVRTGLMPGIGVGSHWFCSPEHLGEWIAGAPSADEQRRFREVLAGAGTEA